jgi:hypothetical protein
MPSPLEAELIGRGITPAIAVDLVREHGEEKIRLQIDILDGLPEKRRARIADPAAYLVTAIRNGHAAPKGFVGRAERQAREEARQARERQETEDRRRRREEEARERALREEVDAYLGRLTPAEREALEAEALARADPEERRACEEAGPARFRAALRLGLVREHVARELLRDVAPAGDGSPHAMGKAGRHRMDPMAHRAGGFHRLAVNSPVSRLSRTLYDRGPPVGLATLALMGFLARSDPERGLIHPELARTGIRHDFFNDKWHGMVYRRSGASAFEFDEA